MDDIDQYLKDHRRQFEEDLIQLLRIPSVSADSQYKKDVQAAAEWVHAQFKSLGLKSELIKTSHHPLIYAETPAVK